jgi:hypothetical protein
MSYFRYAITIICLFIFIDYSSLVLAQSIYDFRKNNKKNTLFNTSKHLERQNKINLTTKIRFRYLSGTYNSNLKEAANSTYSIIWEGFGIGQSVFKKKGIISGDTYDIENKSIDLSYTFGNDYTLTLGGKSVSSGKLTVTTSDSQIFNSSNVEGSGYFSILGAQFGIIEILLGYQNIRYGFLELESDSTSAFKESFKDSGGLYVTGFGFVF